MTDAAVTTGGGKRRSPGWVTATLIVFEVLQVLALPLWLMAAAFSFMAFDSPGSDNNPGVWLFVILVWSYPLWLIAGATLSWVLHRRGRSVLAVFITVVVSVPALLLLAFVGMGLVGEFTN